MIWRYYLVFKDQPPFGGAPRQKGVYIGAAPASQAPRVMGNVFFSTGGDRPAR